MIKNLVRVPAQKFWGLTIVGVEIAYESGRHNSDRFCGILYHDGNMIKKLIRCPESLGFWGA